MERISKGVSRTRISATELDETTTRIIGTYRGPEGMCRLDGLYDKRTDTTELTFRGNAPAKFLDNVAAYLTAKSLPFPKGNEESL
ncbi:MAG: hypothetical protein J4469_01495 [Candidatus Aenigmarchaeota archaeon]|nr:hypothetical protein [Candidatus Aenigmarchaeota archaeon]